MRESKVERECVKIARHHGWLPFKWRGSNQRGVPDHLFFRNGELKIVEFKRPGQKPRKLQLKRHRELAAAGFSVIVIDRIEQAEEVFQ